MPFGNARGRQFRAHGSGVLRGIGCRVTAVILFPTLVGNAFRFGRIRQRGLIVWIGLDIHGSYLNG